MEKPKQFKILERYIEGIVKGYAHSLVVLGKAGIGKTETTIKTLERLGLREGQEYLYLNGHITPLQLFKELKRINELNEPRIGVIDDCEIMLKDMKSVGLLKGLKHKLLDVLFLNCYNLIKGYSGQLKLCPPRADRLRRAFDYNSV